MAKVIIDIMTKHTYLPTTSNTDKGSAFTSKLIAEIAQVLGIQIRKIGRPQGSLKGLMLVSKRISIWPQGITDVSGKNTYLWQF